MRFCTSGYDLCYVPVGTGIDPLEVWIMIRYTVTLGIWCTMGVVHHMKQNKAKLSK